MIWAPDMAYSRADLPRGSAILLLQGDPRKRREVKEGKIEYLTPLKTSTGNVFLKIKDKRLLPRTPQNKRDMRKFCQYHKDHGHDTDDCRHLKIEIEKLIQRGKLKDYVHKETHSMNRSFARDRSRSPEGPSGIMGRVNIISRGRNGGGDSGSARQAYSKRDISTVIAERALCF
ncbi:hypothetical protein LIER_21252 [Lithospermum erythrorhizon]|uniref:Reverse transcriptase domain-containing protein n=1 Tax=Lithospermum erythrorhizon TaxID=34254 RepID=A0AAV3QSF3_LITER